jgi:hypothetical protein
MAGREIKISHGLLKLINGGANNHFETSPNIFLDNPSNRLDYFELFRKAQIVEIANSTVPE